MDCLSDANLWKHYSQENNMRTASLLSAGICLLFICCTNAKKADATVNKTSLPGTSSPVISSSETKPVHEGWKFDTLVFDRKIHIDNDTTMDAMKVDVSLVYPASSPSYIRLQDIQQSFARVFTGNRKFSGNITVAFDTIVGNYISSAMQYGKEWQEEGNEFINFSNYEETKTTHVDFVYQDLIILSSAHYSYLGGAHGAYYIKYDNIDLRDGSIIEENKLFNPGYENALAELIQNAVRERNDSPDEDEHIMLLVEIPEIKPSGNFFFSPEGIVYVYNQYEIAPYVQGPVEITVPYYKLHSIINNDYAQIISSIKK